MNGGKAQNRQIHYALLAGTNNPNEKWWYNEGVNCAVKDQGLKDEKIQDKIGYRKIKQ